MVRLLVPRAAVLDPAGKDEAVPEGEPAGIDAVDNGA